MKKQKEIISIYPEIGNIQKIIDQEKKEFINKRRYENNTAYLALVTKSIENLDP